jgi:hypothetical protein
MPSKTEFQESGAARGFDGAGLLSPYAGRRNEIMAAENEYSRGPETLKDNRVLVFGRRRSRVRAIQYL